MIITSRRTLQLLLPTSDVDGALFATLLAFLPQLVAAISLPAEPHVAQHGNCQRGDCRDLLPVLGLHDEWWWLCVWGAISLSVAAYKPANRALSTERCDIETTQLWGEERWCPIRRGRKGSAILATARATVTYLSPNYFIFLCSVTTGGDKNKIYRRDCFAGCKILPPFHRKDAQFVKKS